MKIFNYPFAMVVLLASLAAAPGTAMADSDSDDGGGPLAATANLDFQIVIPGILRFRVGTDGSGNVDEILFEPPIATLGDGTDTSASSGGDISAGVVTVSVFSNAGLINIEESNNGGGNGLNNGPAGENIPYSEFITVSSDPTNFPAPALSDSATNDEDVTPTSGNNKVTNRSETWTYTYDNSTLYPAGTYGTSANGGRVTYTATSP